MFILGDTKNASELKAFVNSEDGIPLFEEVKGDMISIDTIFTEVFKDEPPTHLFTDPKHEPLSVFLKPQKIQIKDYKKGLFRNLNLEKRFVSSALCFRNFQNVKLSQHRVEI